MEFLMDPAIWVGLFTLIILEIVLGIDNLVFIAILADKLPPHQRDKARTLGLSLALLMRLGLLSVMSWLITLTKPIFNVASFSFSGRDLILLSGGLFLVYKATTELHERMEGLSQQSSPKNAYASFGLVVLQIVVLDAVFSLDAVITAVGMVENLSVMMAAVIIAMIVMIVASKPLTAFVNAHQTVVILCLSFLLMIGFSLVAEGFGFHIPKGYLYAAIGFSILIEVFNQISLRNFSKNQERLPYRERTAQAILKLMGTRQNKTESDAPAEMTLSDQPLQASTAFGEEERLMISGVLTLAERSVRSIMTQRTDISWVDLASDKADIRKQLLETPHSLFPVCKGSLDHVVGVVWAKELLLALEKGENIETFAAHYPPIWVSERMDIFNILNRLRKAEGRLLLVVDEFGTTRGLLTPLDILEVIAGEFPDADESPDILRDGNEWLTKGTTELHKLEIALGLGSTALTNQAEDLVTLAGLLLETYKDMPDVGDKFEFMGFRFVIEEISERRIEWVRISALPDDEEADDLNENEINRN